MHRILLLALTLSLCAAPAARAWTWPTSGPLLRPFVFDPAHPYAAGQHRGIDVGGSLGESVVAPASGTVTFAGTVPNSGRAVTIATSDGYAVTLVHLGSIAVGRGAVVSEGAAVGTVGPSPDTPDPSVYLGVRVASEPQGYVDPLTLLPPRTSPPLPSPLPAPTPEPAPVIPATPTATTPAAEPEVATPAPTDVPAPAVAAPEPAPAAATADPAPAAAPGSAPESADPATAPADQTAAAPAEPESVPSTAESPGAAGQPAPDPGQVQAPAAPAAPAASPPAPEAAAPSPAAPEVTPAEPAPEPVLPDPTPPLPTPVGGFGPDPIADVEAAEAVEAAAPEPTEAAAAPEPGPAVDPAAATGAAPAALDTPQPDGPPALDSAPPPAPAVDDAEPRHGSWSAPRDQASPRVGFAPAATGWLVPAPRSAVRHSTRDVTPRHIVRTGTLLIPWAAVRPELGSNAGRAPAPVEVRGRRAVPHRPSVPAASGKRRHGLPVPLLLVPALAVAGIAVRIMRRHARAAEEDLRGGRLAVCERPAPHRPRGGVRRPVRHVRALPPAEGQRRPDGQRHGRARHAGDGGRRRGRRVPA